MLEAQTVGTHPATDLLTASNDLGDALARSLSCTALVLLRSHGFTAVRKSIRKGVCRSVHVGTGARMQVKALRLGETTFLAEEEACSAAAAAVALKSQIEHACEFRGSEATAAIAPSGEGACSQ